MRKKENSHPIYEDKRVVVVKPLKIVEDILKKSSFLEPIREDYDDEYFKYNDDFEHHIEERVIKKLIINKQLLDIHLNPKSAEPHLYKSKVHSLQPLTEQ